MKNENGEEKYRMLAQMINAEYHKRAFKIREKIFEVLNEYLGLDNSGPKIGKVARLMLEVLTFIMINDKMMKMPISLMILILKKQTGEEIGPWLKREKLELPKLWEKVNWQRYKKAIEK